MEFPTTRIPQSEIALLANILAIITHNMTTLTTLLAQVSTHLPGSTSATLTVANPDLLNKITNLDGSLDLQWDMIQSLERFCPILARTLPTRSSLITQIDISQLPQSA